MNKPGQAVETSNAFLDDESTLSHCRVAERGQCAVIKAHPPRSYPQNAARGHEALKRQPCFEVSFKTRYPANSLVPNGALDYGEELISKPDSIDQLASKIRDVMDRPTTVPSASSGDLFVPVAALSRGEPKPWKP
jgi:hypothetical protein